MESIMRGAKATIVAFCFLGFSANALAADPSLEICTTLYSKGIVDTHNSYTEQERYSYLHDLLSKENFQSYAEFSSWAASAGIDIPLADDLLGFTGDAKSSSSTFQQEWSRFKTETTSQAMARLVATDSDSKVSKVLLNVYQDCERNYFATVLQTQKQIVTVTPQNPPNSFLMHIAAVFPQAGDVKRLEIRQIEPSSTVHCSVSGRPIRFPYAFPGTDGLLQCTKPIGSTVSVLVRTNAGVPDNPISVPKAVSEIDQLRSQISALKAQVAVSFTPVGTIIPFFGTNEQAVALRSQGWWVCDSTMVNDPASAWHLKSTPDLRGKFIMGAGATVAPFQPGGSAKFTIPDQTINSHTTGGFGEPSFNGDQYTHMNGNHAWNVERSIYSQGTWKGTDVPTLPPYLSLIYLIKVK